MSSSAFAALTIALLVFGALVCPFRSNPVVL
jgi:hypothetical protein